MSDAIAEINNYLTKLQRVSLSEKIFFFQNLQVMIKSGLPLSQALSALTKQTDNKKFKKTIQETWHNIEKGEPLSKNLKKYPDIFSEVSTSMIEAGEVSGNLEGILQQLVIQMKKDHELISKVKSALTYPLVVMVAMLGMGIGMIIFVVPKITSIFAEMDAQLPLLTRILIGLSNFIVHNGILTVLFIIVIIGSFIVFIRNRKGK